MILGQKAEKHYLPDPPSQKVCNKLFFFYVGVTICMHMGQGKELFIATLASILRRSHLSLYNEKGAPQSRNRVPSPISNEKRIVTTLSSRSKGREVY